MRRLIFSNLSERSQRFPNSDSEPLFGFRKLSVCRRRFSNPIKPEPIEAEVGHTITIVIALAGKELLLVAPVRITV